jgi:hypothetical protein
MPKRVIGFEILIFGFLGIKKGSEDKTEVVEVYEASEVRPQFLGIDVFQYLPLTNFKTPYRTVLSL